MIAEKSHNVLGQDPITSRQIDELIGLARGLSADGVINPSEVEFLQKVACSQCRDQQPAAGPATV